MTLASNSWLRVFRFPLGHLLVTRAPSGEFRKMQKMLAMLDGELWSKSQVRTRVQVVEITDPALLQKITAALDQPAGSRQYVPMPRLVPGKGVTILHEGEVLTLDGHPGEAQWTVSRGGEPAVVRLKCLPKVGPDHYTITSTVDWRLEKPAGDGPNHEARGWSSTFLTLDGEQFVLRAPYLADNGAADDHTFLVLSATMINTLGTQLRPESGDPEPDGNRVDSVTQAEAQGDQREARFYAVEENVSQIADALGFVADAKDSLSLEYNARTGKLVVTGCWPDFAQVDTVVSAFQQREPQFRIVVGWAETPKTRTEFLAVGDQDATVTLPPPTGASNRQAITLTFRVKELVHAELYDLEYTLRGATGGAGNDNVKPASGAVRLHSGVQTPMGVDTGVYATLVPVNPAGFQVPKPFAEAVELHQRLRQRRQQRLAESARLLETCLVPEFRLNKADLKTAVDKLAEACRRLRFPLPATNLDLAPPGDVQTVEKRKTTNKTDRDGGNSVQETQETEAVVARRQKSAPQRTADLELQGKSLAEILRQLRTAYACRIAVENDHIRISPVPDAALRRFGVAKAILKDAGADLPGFFVRHGVAFQDTDRLLYVPELDTLLAFGSDLFPSPHPDGINTRISFAVSNQA